MENAPKLTNEEIEFDTRVASSLSRLFGNSANLTSIAIGILRESADALEYRAHQQLREQTRLVLTRAYYAGAIRATVTLKPEDDHSENALGVYFEHQVEGEWQAITDEVFDKRRADLTKLVLSQSTVPGDYWFVTTNGAVQAILDRQTDEELALLQAQAAGGASPTAH